MTITTDGHERDGTEGQEGYGRRGTSSTADQHGDAVLANAAAAAFGKQRPLFIDTSDFRQRLAQAAGLLFGFCHRTLFSSNTRTAPFWASQVQELFRMDKPSFASRTPTILPAGSQQRQQQKKPLNSRPPLPAAEKFDRDTQKSLRRVLFPNSSYWLISGGAEQGACLAPRASVPLFSSSFQPAINVCFAVVCPTALTILSSRRTQPCFTHAAFGVLHCFPCHVWYHMSIPLPLL